MGIYPAAQPLKRDDDVCVHLLLDLFGMEPGQRLGAHPAIGFLPLPHDRREILYIVQELVVKRGNTKEAVKEFSRLEVVRNYLRDKDSVARGHFLHHAELYLRLYLPSNPIEIGRTSQYTHFTKKDELGVFARCLIRKRAMVSLFLSGHTAPITAEESEAASGPDSDLHRLSERFAESSSMAKEAKVVSKDDFSMVWSNARKREEVFLGPGRFVNHDCEANVEFYACEDKTLSFVALRDIHPGEELLSFYRDNYFGVGNRDCLCRTCETTGAGRYRQLRHPSSARSESDASDGDEGDRPPSLATSGSSPPGPDSPPDTADGSDGSPACEIVRPRRLARKQNAPPAAEDLDAIRVLWGDPEVRERRCWNCRGGIELELRDGQWVDKERGCLRCKRHRLIFQVRHPNRPAVDKSAPAYISFRQHNNSPRKPADPAAEREKALKKEYELDKKAFDRKYPGRSLRWREEVRARRARAYEFREVALEAVHVHGKIRSRFQAFAATIQGLSTFLVTEIDGIQLVRHRDHPLIRVESFFELLRTKKSVKAALPEKTPRITLMDCEREYAGTWVHIDTIVELLAKEHKLQVLLARFLAHEVDLTFPVPIPAPAPPVVRPAVQKRAPVKSQPARDKGKGRERTASHAPASDLVDPDLSKTVYAIDHEQIKGKNAYSEAHPPPPGARKAGGKAPLPDARIAPPVCLNPADPQVRIYSGVLVYEVEIKDGANTHVIGRLGNYPWVQLSTMLDLVSLKEDEKNRVYARIGTQNKQIYSVPAGKPVPVWNGVWCELTPAKKMAEHFGCHKLLAHLLAPPAEFEELVSALEEQEEDAGEEEEHEGPSSASVIKSPQRSSVKVSPLKRPAPKKYTIQSPRRRTVARVLSDDEAADDEQEAEEEEEQEEEDRFSLAPANEARGRPDKDAEVSESEGEEEEDIVMASDEDADAVEHVHDLDLASVTPDLDALAPRRASPTVNLNEPIDITDTDDSDDDIQFAGAIAPPPEYIYVDDDDDDELPPPVNKGKAVDRIPVPSSGLFRPRPSKTYTSLSPGSSDISATSPRPLGRNLEGIPSLHRSSDSRSSRTISSDGPLGTPMFAMAEGSSRSGSGPSSFSKSPVKKKPIEVSDTDSDMEIVLVRPLPIAPHLKRKRARSSSSECEIIEAKSAKTVRLGTRTAGEEEAWRRGKVKKEESRGVIPPPWTGTVSKRAHMGADGRRRILDVLELSD